MLIATCLHPTGCPPLSHPGDYGVVFRDLDWVWWWVGCTGSYSLGCTVGAGGTCTDCSLGSEVLSRTCSHLLGLGSPVLSPLSVPWRKTPHSREWSPDVPSPSWQTSSLTLANLPGAILWEKSMCCCCSWACPVPCGMPTRHVHQNSRIALPQEPQLGNSQRAQEL